MRPPRIYAESRKDYDVNFTYTSKIQRQLSVYAEFTDTMYVFGATVVTKLGRKRSACFVAESTRNRPLFYVAFTPPMLRYRDDIRDKPGTCIYLPQPWSCIWLL